MRVFSLIGIVHTGVRIHIMKYEANQTTPIMATSTDHIGDTLRPANVPMIVNTETGIPRNNNSRKESSKVFRTKVCNFSYK